MMHTCIGSGIIWKIGRELLDHELSDHDAQLYRRDIYVEEQKAGR
jgi:hypothetical protein